jgi:hypothetical protein
MPKRDERARSVIDKGKDQGYRTVRYRNAKGSTQNGTVLGAGTSSGLKLKVGFGPAKIIVDNVPLATSEKQTSAYMSREGG